MNPLVTSSSLKGDLQFVSMSDMNLVTPLLMSILDKGLEPLSISSMSSSLCMETYTW